VKVFDDLEEQRIFSSRAVPLPIDITKGLLSPVGKEDPFTPLKEVAEFEILADNVVLNAFPTNSLLIIKPLS
jgi:hypothetical protein